MKCEIINGKLFVRAGTPTEQWALDEFFGNMAIYYNPRDYIADASKAEAPEVAAALKADEDAVFGKIG